MKILNSNSMGQRVILVASKFKEFNSLITDNLISDEKQIVIVNSEEQFEEMVVKFRDSIECIFLFHWSRIIKIELLNEYLVIGFHTGDLPYGRGGSPIQNHILQKKYKTFICSFKVVPELDSGPIFQKFPIDLSAGSIYEIVQMNTVICSKMASEMLEKTIVPSPQGNSDSNIPFKRLSPKDSQIPPELPELIDLHDRIRMVDGLEYPKSYLEYGNFRIEFEDSILSGDTLRARVAIRRNVE